MSDQTKSREFDVAWDNLNTLLFRYDLIVQQELYDLYKKTYQKLSDCYEQIDKSIAFTSDQDKIDTAIQAVVQFAVICQEAAERWDVERQKTPITPNYLQQQSLTDEDRGFIAQRRERLANTTAAVGKLEAFFETGTEGAYWSIEVDGLDGYDSLRIIHGGDRLVIYEADGSIMFDEIFVEDHVSGWAPYQSKWPYGRGQQICGGLWVHWIPKGWSPQRWIELFNKSRGKRAELYQSSSEA